MLNYNRFTNPFHRQIVKKQVKSILFQRIKTITLPKNSHMSLEMAYNPPPPDSHFITPCGQPSCQTQKNAHSQRIKTRHAPHRPP